MYNVSKGRTSIKNITYQPFGGHSSGYPVALHKEALMIGALIAKRNVPKTLEALNRRDLETYLKDWVDDATLVHPGDVPGVSGTHTGKEAMRAFYQREFEQFPAY